MSLSIPADAEDHLPEHSEICYTPTKKEIDNTAEMH